MTTDFATRPEDIADAVGVPVGALAITSDQTELTAPQRAALGHIGLDKAPAADVEAFLHLCQRTRLDPWARQIYLIERGGKWTPQTAIDGFRVIAERRDEHAGTTDIEWCGEDGVWSTVWLSKSPPHAARCAVNRHDRDQPTTAVVLFAEFTAGNAKWRSSPAHMIGKCAEAGALRRAFPQDFAGLMVNEEAEAIGAQGARTKVASQRGPSGPVEVFELTGQAPPAEKKKPAPEKPDDRMSGDQQKILLRLIREAQVGDSKAYASHLLDRKVTSLGQLTQGDAATLIDNLEAMLAGDDEPVEGELVAAPPTADGRGAGTPAGAPTTDPAGTDA